MSSHYFNAFKTAQLKTRELHRRVHRNPPENRSHPSVVARKLGYLAWYAKYLKPAETPVAAAGAR